MIKEQKSTLKRALALFLAFALIFSGFTVPVRAYEPDLYPYTENMGYEEYESYDEYEEDKEYDLSPEEEYEEPELNEAEEVVPFVPTFATPFSSTGTVFDASHQDIIRDGTLYAGWLMQEHAWVELTFTGTRVVANLGGGGVDGWFAVYINGDYIDTFNFGTYWANNFLFPFDVEPGQNTIRIVSISGWGTVDHGVLFNSFTVYNDDNGGGGTPPTGTPTVYAQGHASITQEGYWHTWWWDTTNWQSVPVMTAGASAELTFTGHRVYVNMYGVASGGTPAVRVYINGDLAPGGDRPDGSFNVVGLTSLDFDIPAGLGRAADETTIRVVSVYGFGWENSVQLIDFTVYSEGNGNGDNGGGTPPTGTPEEFPLTHPDVIWGGPHYLLDGVTPILHDGGFAQLTFDGHRVYVNVASVNVGAEFNVLINGQVVDTVALGDWDTFSRGYDVTPGENTIRLESTVGYSWQWGVNFLNFTVYSDDNDNGGGGTPPTGTPNIYPFGHSAIVTGGNWGPFYYNEITWIPRSVIQAGGWAELSFTGHRVYVDLHALAHGGAVLVEINGEPVLGDRPDGAFTLNEWDPTSLGFDVPPAIGRAGANNIRIESVYGLSWERSIWLTRFVVYSEGNGGNNGGQPTVTLTNHADVRVTSPYATQHGADNPSGRIHLNSPGYVNRRSYDRWITNDPTAYFELTFEGYGIEVWLSPDWYRLVAAISIDGVTVASEISMSAWAGSTKVFERGFEDDSERTIRVFPCPSAGQYPGELLLDRFVIHKEEGAIAPPLPSPFVTLTNPADVRVTSPSLSGGQGGNPTGRIHLNTPGWAGQFAGTGPWGVTDTNGYFELDFEGYGIEVFLTTGMFHVNAVISIDGVVVEDDIYLSAWTPGTRVLAMPFPDDSLRTLRVFLCDLVQYPGEVAIDRVIIHKEEYTPPPPPDTKGRPFTQEVLTSPADVNVVNAAIESGHVIENPAGRITFNGNGGWAGRTGGGVGPWGTGGAAGAFFELEFTGNYIAIDVLHHPTYFTGLARVTVDGVEVASNLNVSLGRIFETTFPTVDTRTIRIYNQADSSLVLTAMTAREPLALPAPTPRGIVSVDERLFIEMIPFAGLEQFGPLQYQIDGGTWNTLTQDGIDISGLSGTIDLVIRTGGNDYFYESNPSLVATIDLDTINEVDLRRMPFTRDVIFINDLIRDPGYSSTGYGGSRTWGVNTFNFTEGAFIYTFTGTGFAYYSAGLQPHLMYANNVNIDISGGSLPGQVRLGTNMPTTENGQDRFPQWLVLEHYGLPRNTYTVTISRAGNYNWINLRAIAVFDDLVLPAPQFLQYPSATQVTLRNYAEIMDTADDFGDLMYSTDDGANWNIYNHAVGMTIPGAGQFSVRLMFYGNQYFLPSNVSPASIYDPALTYELFTIDFDLNFDGAAIHPEPIEVVERYSITLPPALRSGHNFAGWFTEPNGGIHVGGAGDTWVPEDSVTLYAQWTQQVHTGRTFYVSSFASAGGNGLSLATAFNSIAQLNAIIFGPGDVINFVQGSIFLGTPFILRGSGVDGAPILVTTIDAGHGNARPVIDASGGATWHHNTIEVVNVEYWTIEGLHIQNTAPPSEWPQEVTAPGTRPPAGTRRSRRGIDVRATTGNLFSGGDGFMRGITLRDLEISDVHGYGWHGGGADGGDGFGGGWWDSNGIAFRSVSMGAGGPDGFNQVFFMDLTIEDVLIRNIDGYGIYDNSVYRQTGRENPVWQNIVIRNNTIIDTSMDGFEAHAFGVLFEKNAIFDVSRIVGNQGRWEFTGAMYGHDGQVIQFNEIARSRYNGDSMAFDFDMGAMGTTIFQFNYTHNNEGGFFMSWPGSPPPAMDMAIIRYNISQNNGHGWGGAYAIMGDNRSVVKLGDTGTIFYNNVFFQDNGFWIPIDNTMWHGHSASRSTYFFNNLFYVRNLDPTLMSGQRSISGSGNVNGHRWPHPVPEDPYHVVIIQGGGFLGEIEFSHNAFFGTALDGTVLSPGRDRAGNPIPDANMIFADPLFMGNDPSFAGQFPPDGLTNNRAVRDINLFREMIMGFQLHEDSPLVGMGKVINEDVIRDLLAGTGAAHLRRFDLYRWGANMDIFGNPVDPSLPRTIGAHHIEGTVVRAARPELALNPHDGTSILITNYSSFDTATNGALQFSTNGGFSWNNYNPATGIDGLIAMQAYTILVRYSDVDGSPGAQSPSNTITTGRIGLSSALPMEELAQGTSPVSFNGQLYSVVLEATAAGTVTFTVGGDTHTIEADRAGTLFVDIDLPDDSYTLTITGGSVSSITVLGPFVPETPVVNVTGFSGSLTNYAAYTADFGTLQVSVNGGAWQDYDPAEGFRLSFFVNTVRVRYSGTAFYLPSYASLAWESADIPAVEIPVDRYEPMPALHFTKIDATFSGLASPFTHGGGFTRSLSGRWGGNNALPGTPEYNPVLQQEFGGFVYSANTTSYGWFELRFRGSAIEMIASRNTDHGGMLVFLNDVAIGSVDLRADERLCQMLVARIDVEDFGFGYGDHVLRVELSGRVRGGWAGPDAFIIYGRPIVPVDPTFNLTGGSAFITNLTSYDTDTYGPLQFRIDDGAWEDYNTATGITSPPADLDRITVRHAGRAFPEHGVHNHYFIEAAFHPSLPSGTILAFPHIAHVGPQVGDLIPGEASSVTFTVTTQNIPAGTPITLNNINDVLGLSLVTTETTGNVTIVEIATSALTPTGTHPLTLRIADLLSPGFNLVVGAALTPPELDWVFVDLGYIALDPSNVSQGFSQADFTLAARNMWSDGLYYQGRTMAPGILIPHGYPATYFPAWTPGNQVEFSIEGTAFRLVAQPQWWGSMWTVGAELEVEIDGNTVLEDFYEGPVYATRWLRDPLPDFLIEDITPGTHPVTISSDWVGYHLVITGFYFRPNPTVVTGVSIDQNDHSLNVGATSPLTATVTPTDATDSRVIWSSNNTAVATVNSAGLVTAVAAGTAQITVRTVDGHYTDSITITVTAANVAVTGVTIQGGNRTLEEGDTVTLTAVVAPTGATNPNIAWASSNPGVASVNPTTGLVTAIAAGTTQITVTTVDGSFSHSITITVEGEGTGYTPVPVTGVTITGGNISLNVGATRTLTANIQPQNATNQGAVWFSTNTSVATVDANGVVTAVAVGTATIMVITAEGPFSAYITVTVTAPGGGGNVGGGGGGGAAAPAEPTVPTDPPIVDEPAVDDTIIITAPEQEEAAETGEDIVIDLDYVVVTFPRDTVDTWLNEDGEIEDVYVNIALDQTNLPATISIDVTREGGTVVDAPGMSVDVNISAPEGTNYHRIVAVLEDGTLVGGSYNPETGVFTFETDVTGSFTIGYFENLQRIHMNINSMVIADYAQNRTVTMDVMPILQNGRALIPLRFVAETLGASVYWNDVTYEVTIILDGEVLVFAIGEYLPGMDVPAQLINGRTYVPLRFVVEYFDAVVFWDGETGDIEILRMAIREEDEE